MIGDPILIFDSGYSLAADPAVACLWPSITKQYFIVVWNTSYDIYVQALTPAGDLYGSALAVADSLHSEEHPAIACEVDDYTCLVVYEKEQGSDLDVYGRRVHMTNFGLDLPVAEFYTGSDADYDLNPAVVWSSSLEEYLVAWQDLYTTTSSSYDRIRVSRIYEDEHGEGYSDELKAAAQYLNDTSATGEYDQFYPDVDFNLISGRYMVTYVADRPEGYAMVGVSSWGGSSITEYLETGLSVYLPPAVAYSGGHSGVINAEDEFLAVNIESHDEDYQLQGAYFWKNEWMAKDVLIETVINDEHNIYGRFVDNGGFVEVFLPLLMR